MSAVYAPKVGRCGVLRASALKVYQGVSVIRVEIALAYVGVYVYILTNKACILIQGSF